jgi:hypothetical protein
MKPDFRSQSAPGVATASEISSDRMGGTTWQQCCSNSNSNGTAESATCTRNLAGALSGLVVIYSGPCSQFYSYRFPNSRSRIPARDSGSGYGPQMFCAMQQWDQPDQVLLSAHNSSVFGAVGLTYVQPSRAKVSQARAGNVLINGFGAVGWNSTIPTSKTVLSSESPTPTTPSRNHIPKQLTFQVVKLL